eukprot:TRINITY_DN10355_c0_g2_i7.p1 TRINITY_DN10355_c0_g2~~TRINITY_DN10355_c0_g2_i7.p1  ORF type:complete len:342 (-),score=26.54 TRINITY_DN10355_c0_g2_i7:177-1202(-)
MKVQYSQPRMCMNQARFCKQFVVSNKYKFPHKLCRKQLIVVNQSSGFEYGFVASTKPPKGIIHFAGGAFVGAAPQLSYSLLIELLAQAGYSVITPPYALTFQHEKCAHLLHARFYEARQQIQRDRKFEYYVRDELPVLGVGHSNGALMHLLMGSYFPQHTMANVIISFNNKSVEGAIPVDLDGLNSVFGSSSIEINPDFLEGELKGALQQIGSVLTEVSQGTRDFQPTPQESRSIIKERYGVPNTLLVKFSNDDLDESEEMYEILTSQQNGRRQVRLLKIVGTHVTPCGPDVQWQVQREFNVQDALLMGARAVAQFPVRNMARFITTWLDEQVFAYRQLQM